MLAIFFTLALFQSTADCPNVEACRAQALIAEAAGNVERFHDLAWRAVQKGKPNDPALMTLLARAMAESGRPGDAIVMLSRLADMGVKVDASGDEFKVVRTLKDWPAVEAKFDALTAPAASDKVGKPTPAKTPATAASRETPRSSPPAPGETAHTAPAARPETPSPETKSDAPVAGDPVLEFDAPAFTPAGIAYDAVSRRFVVGDRDGAKLLVLDQQSHHVVTMVGATAAGFYDRLGGLAIDPRRGDLWVVSSKSDADGDVSALHKLQLVSGRTLMDVQASGFGAVRFVDVVVTPSGTVYALDAAGRRVFRLKPGTRTLEVASTLSGTDVPQALAADDDRVAFVSAGDRLLRVDLVTGRASGIHVPGDPSAATSLQLRGDTLFAIRGDRLVRMKLDGARTRITAIHAIDAASAVTAAGGTVFYLASPGEIKAVRD